MQLSTLFTIVKKINCELVDNVEKSYPHDVNRCITKEKTQKYRKKTSFKMWILIHIKKNIRLLRRKPINCVKH